MPRAKGKRLTQEEDRQIVETYLSGMSMTTVAKVCGCGSGTVRTALKRAGVQQRVEPLEYGKCVRRDFFRDIQTEQQAYFLGLLIADGSVSGDSKITLTLQERDRAILEQLAMCLGMQPTEVRYQKPHGKAGPQARLRFCSRSMREDLATYGVVPNKAKTTYLPILAPQLMPHLIRGVFDGDGHVSEYIVYVSGSEAICTGIRSHLASLGIETYLYQQPDTGVWYVKGSGRQGRTQWLHYMYSDATVFIDRKYQIALTTHLNRSPVPQ